MKKPNPCGAARCEAPLRSLGRLDTKPGLGFVDSFFDDEVEYIGPVKCYSPQAKISAEGYRARGLSFVAVKIDDADVAEWQSVTATFYGVELVALDMVDLDSGTIYSIDDLDQVFLPLFSWDNEDVYSRVFNLPLRGSPVLVVDRRLVPIAFDWQTMKPAEIVDCLYKPGITNFKSLPERAGWMDMPTKDFLPFVDKYGQFKYREWPGKIHSDEELKEAAKLEEIDLNNHPPAANLDRFGGWLDGPQLEATGRFRIARHNDKWWFVDPDGHLFWSLGAIRISASSAMTPLNGEQFEPRRYGRKMPPRHCFFEDLPQAGSPFAKFYETCDELLRPSYLKRGETEWYDFSSANLYRKYGEDYVERFADIAHRRLHSWGFNTVSNSSDKSVVLKRRTPYIERVECQSRFIEGSNGIWWKFRDPFDPSFCEKVRKALEGYGTRDPWCVGFYVDNEINWGDGLTDLARWTLNSPEDQPARIEFMKFLKERNVAPDKVSYDELREFTDIIIHAYFKNTRDTIKAFDPDMLYLGCRFPGAPQNPTKISSKYVDAISINLYCRSLKGWKLPFDLDCPVIISEFHFGGLDRGPFGRSLINCHTQEGRAKAIRRYLADALRNPLIIGTHWHQFSDQPVTGRFDGEYFQVGLTDVCDSPYPETVAAFRESASQLYQTRAQE